MILKIFQAEIFLSLVILFQLLVNTNLIRNLVNNLPLLNKETTLQLYIILFFTIFLLNNSKIYGVLYNNLLYCDISTQSLKLFLLLISCMIIPFLKESLLMQKINFIEFDTIFLLSLISSLLLISSSDFLLVYILIEMQSLCFYILASFKRNSAYSVEAGMKYFIFGSIVSCFFLLGLSFLYGITGTLNFYDLSLLCLYNYAYQFDNMLFFSLYLISILFFFKLAIIPFHFWALDVYEGAPLASTIIFTITTKPVLIHLLIKWIFILGALYSYLRVLFFSLGILSIVIGTFMSIKQKRLKRLFIYSSIAQVGFLFLSLSLDLFGGSLYAYFFLFIYILSSIVLWGVLSIFYINKDKIYRFSKKENNPIYLSDFENLFQYNFDFCLIAVCLFFSIAGIPPYVGFLSKMYVLLVLIQNNYFFLACFILFISSIAIYYYIRVIKIIFFDYKLTKSIQVKKNQIIFNFNNSNLCFFIISICQMTLLSLFCFSDTLLYIAEYLIMASVFFSF